MDRFTVHDVAKLAGIHANTVRALEKAGIIQCERTPAGFRVFDSTVLKRIATHYKKKQAKWRKP